MAKGRHDKIIQLLQSWGLYRVLGVPGVSYPSMTVEARLLESGGISGHNPGPRIPRYLTHQAESEADKIITGWKDRGGVWPRRYLVTWCQYVGAEGKGMGCGQSPEDRMRIRMIAAGCSERTYWRTLEDVHEILSRRLKNHLK